jgi:lipopolysaccharide assembly outer membrane protein LptD (OstA)
MQIKNKLFFILLSILILFKSSFYLSAEEFDIAAEKIVIDKEKNILIGTGSVVAKDKAGRTIKSDKMIYKKSSEVLIAEGFVEIFDLE